MCLSRNERKLNKFSESFIEIFNFFENSYKAKILTFSGNEDFKVEYDKDSYNAKICFKQFENGLYTIKYENGFKSTKTIKSSEPEILYSVIKAKKSWGLWIKEWALGIGERNFTKNEILSSFTDNNIIIPKSLMKNFDDLIEREKYNWLHK